MASESIGRLPWRTVMRSISSGLFLVVGMLLYVPTQYLSLACTVALSVILLISAATPSWILCKMAPFILNVLIPPALLFTSTTLLVVHWPDTGISGIPTNVSDHSGISS